MRRARGKRHDQLRRDRREADEITGDTEDRERRRRGDCHDAECDGDKSGGNETSTLDDVAKRRKKEQSGGVPCLR